MVDALDEGYVLCMNEVPGGVRIRRAVPDDAEALAKLHVDVWEDAYTGLMPGHVFVERRATLPQRSDGWRKNLAASPAATTLMEADSGLIGFASIGPGRDDDVAIPVEVWALYLRSAWRGRGVGHALLAATLAEGAAYLWLLDGNARAMNFYGQHGFVADGSLRHDEYGTELRMVR
jgi:GNAT superfamily N-acetyltransferase